MTTRIRPRAVQVARYPPAAQFGPRTLRDYEFVWLLSGSARWTVDDPADAVTPRHAHDLRPGTLLLARQGLIDTYAWDAKRESSHAYVHFEMDERGSLPADSDWPLVREMEEPLAGLCSYLLALASIDTEAARDRRDQIVGTLLDVFVRGPLPQTAHPIAPSRLLPTIEFVKREWLDGVRLMSLDELANAAQISTGHFARVFQDEFGRGPASALELIRLGRAAISLQRTNLTLHEIAGLSGFSNPYHFSRRFSSAYGDSPGRFRGRAQVDPLWPLSRAGLLPLWNLLS